MNKIVFEVLETRKFPSGHADSTVNIHVDGKPLADVMQAYELPMATKEGHPGLAGAYYAITTASSSLGQYYLGKDNADRGLDQNKTALLVCICGIEGCWSLLCKIRVLGNTVTWTDFEQPHRDEEWDYSNFEGFVFDRQQYLDAIEAMKNA